MREPRKLARARAMKSGRSKKSRERSPAPTWQKALPVKAVAVVAAVAADAAVDCAPTVARRAKLRRWP
jgi:hypothetical protein